ncbi:MAG TPA: HAD family phosphatase [Gemmatimonas sp.]|nr:HAD family phosphatase [Gemmatimonas sp.]
MIFDCDGVLVDSERIANREFADLLREIGLDYTLPEMFETFVGNSMPRCVEIITERLGHAPPDDLLDRYSGRVAAVLPGELQAVEGVVGLLNALDHVGVPYCVASNGEHPLMAVKLRAAGLLDRFEGKRFSSADVARPKPAPDLFLHASGRSAVAPGRCVVVEDSPLGVAGANAAGMQVFGFADVMPEERLRAAGAHTVVRRLAELLPLLGLSTPS